MLATRLARRFDSSCVGDQPVSGYGSPVELAYQQQIDVRAIDRPRTTSSSWPNSLGRGPPRARQANEPGPELRGLGSAPRPSTVDGTPGSSLARLGCLAADARPEIPSGRTRAEAVGPRLKGPLRRHGRLGS